MDLLRALYDPQVPLPKDSYQNVLEELEYFSVSSQVYMLLKQQGKLAETPLFFQERLKENYTQTLYKNIFIKSQTEQILNAFEDLGIDVIPLKGTVFSEKYFGHIGARPTSDIDLLIKVPDVESAIQCVKTLGFRDEAECISGHFHCSYSKNIPGSPIPLSVELHWDLLIENTASLQIDEFWEQALPVKKHIKELSSYHTFYMICLHGWRHNMDSPKYFLDIVQLLHLLHNEFDYSLLIRDAASHKTRKRIIRTLSIVYQQFPHLNAIKTLPYRRENLNWDYNFFRKKDEKSIRRYADFIDYQFFSYDSAKHSFIELLKWIVPSKAN
jgi:hypothetical protein